MPRREWVSLSVWSIVSCVSVLDVNQSATTSAVVTTEVVVAEAETIAAALTYVDKIRTELG